jgi:RNA polymerase I-specific transcription initiation factor RRN6
VPLVLFIRNDWTLTGLDLYLILYSRLTDLVQGFPCPLLADEKTESVSVPDPFILKIPKIPKIPKAAGVSSPEDMSRHYSKFVFRQVHHSPTHATKTRYNPNLTLIKLFWTDLSLAVHETLFKGPDNHWERDEKNVPLEGSSVQQVKKHVTHRKKGEIDDEEIDDEEFVVDDWDDSAISRLTLRQTGPKGFMTESSHDRNKDLQWTLDWTSVYAHTVANLMAFTNPRDPEGTQLTLNHIIESLKKVPGGASGRFSASETM